MTSPSALLRSLDHQHLLFGRDDTPGIVSVSADRRGRARVWRRIDGQVVMEQDTYPNWFFLARRELLGDLPVVELPVSILESKPELERGVTGIVELQGDNPLRYLVLGYGLDEVERACAERAQLLIDEGVITQPLSDLIFARPPVEQYLMISGRTHYKGMTYADVRRLQFDFETTGLGLDYSRIFMVAVKDSDGFTAVLDTEHLSEAELLTTLVHIIRERDPDIIENHNIFEFDIRFLVKRAQALDVALPLGRDGSSFSEARDNVKIGASNESFTRFSLEGREIVDTLHATRRFSAIQRDLRSNSLKEAAKYFGVAADDREYVAGQDIWKTFQADPERVRRYCFDDVEEVDALSRVLLASSFALASMVPKSYERIATAGTGQGLIEPLLVRAYLMNGYGLPTAGGSGSYAGGRTAVFTTGVVHNVVKADIASLYPSIMLAERIGPTSDHLGAFLGLLEELTRLRLHHKSEARQSSLPADDRAYHDALQSAMKVLINSFYGSLGANFALFCDKTAAERVTTRGREILQLLLDELERRGAILIEADTDGVLFSLPSHPDGHAWTYEEEQALVEEISQAMPAGIHVEHDGRYQAMYSYLEKNYALLDYESATQNGYRPWDRVRLVGSSFRSAKTEELIQRFLGRAIRLLLEDDYEGIRDAYRQVCAALRNREVPCEELCVSMPLTKSPEKYAAAKRKEEPYEVYLAAGKTNWRSGTRISYYQARDRKKLLEPGSRDYDPDHYIARLHHTCKQRLEKAFTPEDFESLFSESAGLFDTPVTAIQAIRVTRRESLESAEDTPAGPEADDQEP